MTLPDLLRRVPSLSKKEVATLAELGALNGLPQHRQDQHRRGASWQIQAAAQPLGPLLEGLAGDGNCSPLQPMTPQQRMAVDFTRSGVTIGSHPMAFHRVRLQARGVITAAMAHEQRHGAVVKVAGCIITRQRPETAKGFVFLSLEDETGILNVIVSPDLFERHRKACLSSYVFVKGILQNTWSVVSVKAGYVEPLPNHQSKVTSHNFH